MRIRRGTAADIPVLMNLEKSVLTAAHWTVTQYESMFSSDGPSRLVLIIEEDAGMQGFVIARVLSHDWEIENIAVAGPAQRRGFGSFLLEQLLDLAGSAGADRIFLEVRESNLAARRLYEKQAFVQTGRRRLYYRAPDEDAIIYQIKFV